MKKIFALCLSMLMLIALIGCGNQGELVVEPADPIKVGFIYLHDENSTYDANFLRAAEDFRKETREEQHNGSN